MACIHEYLIKNKDYEKYGRLPEYFRVPCGKCVNCLSDKRNDLQMRCEYELDKFKTGTFCTLTYDDIYLPIVQDKKGNPIASLKYKDFQDMNKRLRSNMDRLKINDVYKNRHYKYLAVGEYGDQLKRPHIHVLFFGLDFIESKDLIANAWGKGIVQCLPIKEGGIRYVLKYLEKGLNNKEMMKMYDENNLERPFQKHSIGLGRGLFEENKEYIKKSRGNIEWRGRERPVNRYYKNLMLCYDRQDFKKIKEEMKTHNLPINKYTRTYTREQIEKFKRKKARINEKNAIIKARNRGIPMEEPKEETPLYELI